MSVRALVEKGSVRSLLRALAAWTLTALLLCFLTACVVRAHGIGSENFAYLSAGLSFFCAFAAGAAGGRGAGKLGAGLLVAVFLCIALLTAGFLLGRRAPDPSSVLSVLSFSSVGAVAGSLLFGRKPAAAGNSNFQRKKKQNGKRLT